MPLHGEGEKHEDTHRSSIETYAHRTFLLDTTNGVEGQQLVGEARQGHQPNKDCAFGEIV
jgi:hypothetical protein